MSRFLQLLILCMAFAVLRAVAIVAVALAVPALIVSFIARPKQTLAFVATLALSALTVTQPLACIFGLVVIASAILASRNRRRNEPPSAIEFLPKT